MMKTVKIIMAALMLAVLAVPLFGCGSDDSEAGAAADQLATVQRGDLSVEITAAGNLALSHTEDLAIDLFYQEGTIEAVLVEEGDTVEEGQELVRLDTDEWGDELSALEKALATAQRSLTAKEIDLAKAERQVITKERTVADRELAVNEAERQVSAKDFAVRQAELNVETAEYNLSQIYEVKEAQNAVDNAQYALDFAISVLTGEFGGGGELDNLNYWTYLKSLAEEELVDAQEELEEVLSGSGISLSSDVVLEVASKQLAVEQKQMLLEDARVDLDNAVLAVDDAKFALEDAKLDVEYASQDVADAEQNLEDARQDMADAQSDLDEAQGLRSVITAPFAGFITKVNVEGGDEVMNGTVAVQLADPNEFEAEILVSEIDISQVALNGAAVVVVDAMDLSLPATVTHIAPTATISSGVVNYKVKVTIQSMTAARQQRQEAMQEETQNTASGALPEQLQQAIDEGRITQEQLEAMMAQRQQAAQVPAEEDIQLREGMTVTISIIVAESTDALLVPNAAVTQQGMKSYVKVSRDGVVEEREVETGISDWQYTDIISGLEEGEQVVVPQGTAAVSTTSQTQGRGGVMMFGGPQGR